jgi:hypothetical protein
MAQWTRRPWLIGLSMAGAYSVLTGIRASYHLGSLDGIHAVEIAAELNARARSRSARLPATA